MSVVYSQKAATAYLKSKQLLPLSVALETCQKIHCLMPYYNMYNNTKYLAINLDENSYILSTKKYHV